MSDFQPDPNVAFDGAGYNHDRDQKRLLNQMERIWAVIEDGEWHTIYEISERTGDPHQSVSADLRSFRKKKFGGHRVDRRHISGGLFTYRLVLRPRLSRPGESNGNSKEEGALRGQAGRTLRQEGRGARQGRQSQEDSGQEDHGAKAVNQRIVLRRPNG